MASAIVPREEIKVGDRVFTIEDLPAGTVTVVEWKFLELASFDASSYRVPLAEVFTSTAGCVTLQCTREGLHRFVRGS